jgi:Protein of unknown function (DUF3089)
MRLRAGVFIAGIALALAATVVAGAPVSGAGLQADYADMHNWLCWPGKSLDACQLDLTTTVVAADGHTRVDRVRSAAKPAIDCFYVYPTVSLDPEANASLAIEPEERTIVRAQFAYFGTRCRLFAPVYRQRTIAGYRAEAAGHPLAGWDASPGVAYQDVKDAWEYYLKHANQGRGVVLFGHSQGAVRVARLIRESIDGQAGQKQLVSALLIGNDLAVPERADTGGDFQSVPLCRQVRQVGCAIAFSSFRASAPPPTNTLFGKAPRAGMRAACVNPAALRGGVGPLHAYLPSASWQFGPNRVEEPPWVSGANVATPFVSLPGLLSAACIAAGHVNYLAITVHSASTDKRIQDIPGDLRVNGELLPEWGLHLIEVNLTMGSLLDILAAESRTWAAKHRVGGASPGRIAGSRQTLGP